MDYLTLSTISFIDWIAGSTLALNLVAALIYLFCTQKLTGFLSVFFCVLSLIAVFICFAGSDAVSGFVLGTITMLTLGTVLIYLFKTLRVTEFVLVSFGVVLLDLVHQAIRYGLKKGFHIEEYLEAINLLWYTSFALTDLIFVVLVAAICSKFSLMKDRASRLILLGYMLMAAIQIARYIERTYFSTDIIQPLYTSLIPALNICITLALVGYAIKTAANKAGARILFLYLSIKDSKWTL